MNRTFGDWIVLVVATLVFWISCFKTFSICSTSYIRAGFGMQLTTHLVTLHLSRLCGAEFFILDSFTSMHHNQTYSMQSVFKPNILASDNSKCDQTHFHSTIYFSPWHAPAFSARLIDRLYDMYFDDLLLLPELTKEIDPNFPGLKIRLSDIHTDRRKFRNLTLDDYNKVLNRISSTTFYVMSDKDEYIPKLTSKHKYINLESLFTISNPLSKLYISLTTFARLSWTISMYHSNLQYLIEAIKRKLDPSRIDYDVFHDCWKQNWTCLPSKNLSEISKFEFLNLNEPPSDLELSDFCQLLLYVKTTNNSEAYLSRKTLFEKQYQSIFQF